MEQPEGFIVKGQERKVYRLKKALYGLKQASIAWNKQANKSLTKLGFKRCLSDTGVYTLTQNNHTLVVVLYVDDVLFMGNNTVAQKTAPMFAHFGKIGMVRSSDISKKYDIIT